MNYIDIATAIQIHDEIIEKIGGLSGYNNTNIGYLDSALNQIKNDEFYPHFADKLTHIIFACVKFHPFNDGNKRTSIYLGMHFLDFNGFSIENFAQTMENVVVGIADKSISKEQLKSIIEAFITDSKGVL